MLKKDAATKIEKLQKQIHEELTATRKRIRKQKDVTALEYAMLFEDDPSEARNAARAVEAALAPFTDPEAKLVLIRVKEGQIMCTAGLDAISLRPSGDYWTFKTATAVEWTDKPLGHIGQKAQEMANYTFEQPLHRIEMAVGEEQVSNKLNNFKLFYRLTKLIGYRPRLKKHLDELAHEREQTEASCRRHLIELKAVMDELYFRGPRSEIATKGREAEALIQRTMRLGQEMLDDVHDCELYEVDTEASRELRAFGEKWIVTFKL